MTTKIIKLFANVKILLQNSALGCQIDLNFSEDKLAVEGDEKGHKNRNIDYEIQIKKQQKKSLIVSLLELILIEKISMSMLNLVGLLVTLMNQMKNQLEN